MTDDPWLLETLSFFRSLPRAFLGGQDVRLLGAFISGYSCSRIDLGIDTAPLNPHPLLVEFSAWLKSTDSSTVGSTDWLTMIERIDPSETNVNTFFKLFEEFLGATGRVWPDRNLRSAAWTYFEA